MMKRALLALVVTTRLFALNQTFSENGYVNEADLPVYNGVDQVAWQHINCNAVTTECLHATNGRAENFASGTARWYGAIWTNFAWPADQSSEVSYISLGANNQNKCLGPLVRGSGSTTSATYYAACYYHQNTIQVVRVVANTPTVLRTIQVTLAAGDRLMVAVTGSTLTTTVTAGGSATHYTDTDSTIAAGRPGIAAYFGAAGGTNAMVDAWTADYAVPAQRPTQWFVAPGGSASGAGTRAEPFSMNYARRTSADGFIRPGDTVWVLAGSYAGASQQFNMSGTAEAPVTFRAYPGSRPVLTGTLGGPSGNVVEMLGSHLQLWGFEITEANGGKRWSNLPTADGMMYQQGVLLQGSGSRMINSLVHNTAQGIFFTAINGEVYGSIVANNGWRGGNRGYGHNIYTQGTRYRHVTDSAIYAGFGLNIQGYGTSTNAVGLRVDGVTSFEGGFLSNQEADSGAFYDHVVAQDSWVVTGVSGSPPVITVSGQHGKIVDDDVKAINLGGCTSLNGDWLVASVPSPTQFTVKNYSGAAQNCNAAYTSGGTVYTGTFVVDSELRNSRGYLSTTTNGTTANWGSNYICRVVGMLDTIVVGGQSRARFENCTDLTISGNTFVGNGGNLGVSGANWSTTLFPANTYLSNEPVSGKNVYTTVNRYEPWSAFVTIYNWEGSTAHEYDPSAFLQPGDPYEIVDTQNPLAVVATGTFTGSPITLPLNLTAVNAVKGGVWGPAITSITVASNVATVTLAENVFWSAAFNQSEGSKFLLSGAGHAGLNGVKIANQPTAENVFSFSAIGVPDGTYAGGTAQWYGPLGLTHTTPKFNCFLVRRRQQARPVTLALRNSSAAATQARVLLGVRVASMDFPTVTSPCAYESVCTMAVDSHLAGKMWYRWELLDASGQVVTRSDPAPVVVN